MADTFNEDPVRIKLAGQEIPVSESYEVHSGILEVPAEFSISVGHGGMLAELTATYPPNTPFELWIGDRKVMEGETDGYAATSDSATLSLTGRDLLARLHDTQLVDERTFAEKTYAELTRTMLEEEGLGDKVLFALNAANRKAITGKEAVQLEHKKAVEDLTDTGVSPDGDKSVIEVHRSIKGEVGVTRLEFLLKQYRRAGLFLWADHNGDFVLSQPDPAQKPLYRIVRRRGSEFNEVSVERSTVSNSLKPRYSEIIVCGRAGGGKHGRAAFLDRFIDEEMVAFLNPNPADRADGGKRRKVQIIRDPQVRTLQQAKFLSRRKMAEGRRAGWRLTYTVSGHSAPAIGGGRAIWQPDTTVEVVDDELGIEGVMYLESVTFKRATDTVTELHVMRIEDLIFAEEPEEVVKKRPKLQTRRGVTTVARVVTGTPGGPAVWFTDPNIAVGAPVIIDPDNEVNLEQTTTVTLKPFTPGAAPSGVLPDADSDFPGKPTP